MKKLIYGCWSSGAFDENAFAKAILLFRNTPRSGGASPAQRLFGHPVRDLLPAHRRSFAAEWQQTSYTMEKRARRTEDQR